MQFKPTLLALALAAASTGAFAAPAAITDLTISSGTFAMPGFTVSPIPWTGNAPTNWASAYQSIANAFNFGVHTVSIFTGDGTMAPFGGTPVNGGPIPNGTVDSSAGTISVNMSAWTAYYNGTNFNQGANPVTGSWNPTTGAYSLAWSSTIVGGPFGGNTGDWTITGTAVAAPVPEASTYGMMVVGLGLVGAAVMRRRKA